MNINECSTQLKQLSKAHSHNEMSLTDYMTARKLLLDALDLNINGVAQQAPSVDLSSTVQMSAQSPAADIAEPLDKTQPYFAKKLDTCMNFIKGSTNR